MICSAPMHAPEESIDFMPNVQARSPLARNKRPKKPWLTQTPQGRQTAWPNLAEGMIGALLGTVPFATFLTRKRYTGALVQALGFTLGGGLLYLWWTHPLQWISWFLIGSAWVSGMMAEAHVRMNAAEPARTIASFAFSLVSAVLFRAAILGVVYASYPAIQLQGVRGHADGLYFAEKIPPADYQIGDLVAFNPLHNRSYRPGGVISVAPIIAEAGQTVQNHGFDIFVDDASEPETGTARHPTGTYESRTLTVPTGAIVVYELPLRTRTPEEFLGRVVYQWTPVTERGSVRWPPVERADAAADQTGAPDSR